MGARIGLTDEARPAGRWANIDLTKVPRGARTHPVQALPYEVTVTETCACGGSFSVRTVYRDALPQLRDWRARHRHRASRFRRACRGSCTTPTRVPAGSSSPTPTPA